MYILLNDLKDHVLVDRDFFEDDNLMLIYINAAEDAVARYLNKKLEDTLVDGELPASIYAAILLYAGHLYANRETVAFAQASEIPLSFTYLLNLNRNYTKPF